MNSVTLLEKVVSVVDIQAVTQQPNLGLQVIGQTKVCEMSVVCM